MRIEGYKSAIFKEVRKGGLTANPAIAPGFLFMAPRGCGALRRDALPIRASACAGAFLFLAGEVA